MSRVLFALVLFVAVGCDRIEPAAPKAGKAPGVAVAIEPHVAKKAAAFPPDDWTHKELAEHLDKRG